MQKLLSIHKEDMELLTDYISWVNAVTNNLMVLCYETPSHSPVFSRQISGLPTSNPDCILCSEL